MSTGSIAAMTVHDAQREVRSVFLGGAVGQLVSGSIWLVSVLLGTAGNTRAAILALVVGGMSIFPITQLVLRALGRPFALRPGNPLRGLAMQIAFTVPVLLPVAGGAALANLNWFYPACAVVVGAHYLPFIFLYGMREFAVLAALLVGGGVASAFLRPQAFTPAGWFTAAALLAFGIWAAVSRRRWTTP